MHQRPRHTKLHRLSKAIGHAACAPLLALALATTPASATSNLPSMGEFSQLSMNPQQEYELGQEILASLRLQLPILEDPVVTHYLNNLGSKLVAATDNSHFPFTFLVVNEPSINAFAAPGGIIVVHSGLIDAAENEAELAAVLAHEIAHVTQRHIVRFYDKSGQANLSALVGIVAAVLLSAYSTEAAQASLLAGVAAGSSTQLKFSRDNEKEADRHGREVLEDAGFDVSGMGSFFKKLQTASLSDPGKVTEFLQTHPLPASRVSDAWRPGSSKGGQLDSPLFHYIKARVAVLTHAPNQATAVLTYDKADVQHYAEASRYLLLRQPVKARAELDKIEAASEETLLLANLLRAETYLTEHAPEKAILLLRPLLQRYPDHPAILADLSSAYMDNNQPEKAYELLRFVDVKTETFLPLLKLKADAASQAGHPVTSHEFLASWYEMRGQLKLALEQVQVAQNAAPPTSIAATRLKAREQVLRDQLKEKRDQH